MNVLVTGATGFVGREIVRQLTKAAYSTRILVRPGHRSLSGTPCEVEAYPGDILSPASLEAAARGMDAVIHLVGIISEVGPSTFQNIHAVGTANVITAAQLAKVRRFVHMSALGTRPGARSRYHQSKWEAEESVRQSGLDWTIFRPSLVYGREDHFLNMFERMSRWLPALPIIGNGCTLFQPVAVEQVSHAFVAALEKRDASRTTFDLAGPERLTMRQILETLLEVTERKRLLVPIPMTVARLQAAGLEFILGRCLRKAPPLNRDQLLMLQEDNIGDPSAADRMFHLTHDSLTKGLSRWLDKTGPRQTSMP